MSDEIVILGQGDAKAEDGNLVITTPHGDMLRVSSADIMRTDDADASESIKRYIISPTARVSIEVDGRQLTGVDAHDGTILKWVDDGGTISKSRDDD